MSVVTFLIGAGASRACAGATANTDDNYLPPLVTDLFSNARGPYVTALHQYPAAEAAADRIRQKLKGSTPNSLEQVLKEMRESTNPIVAAQYRQMPLYLRDLLWNISRYYIRSGSNFYQTTLEVVADFVPRKFARAVFLTLNYDLFLDRAFQDLLHVEFRQIHDYTANKEWCLLKLHGSVNWGFPVTLVRESNPAGFLREIGRLDQHPKPGDAEICIIPDMDNRYVSGKNILYPALAAPIADKTVAACPADHLELARKLLRETTHFCVLGCRVADPDILGLVAELKSLRRFLIANRDQDDGVAAWNCMMQVNRLFAEDEGYRPHPPKGSIGRVGFQQIVADGSLASFLAS